MLKNSGFTLPRHRYVPIAALGASAAACIIVSHVIALGTDTYKLFGDFVAITLIIGLMLAAFRTTPTAAQTSLLPPDAIPGENTGSELSKNVSELEAIATTISDVIRKHAERSLSHG
jgi:hypothetical protein